VPDCQRIFVADIDKTLVGTHCISANDHPLQHAVGIALHDRAVHVGAGVALVGVADDVAGAGCQHVAAAQLPLGSGGKTCPAAPAQARRPHLGNHLFGGHLRKHPRQRCIPARCNILVNLEGVNLPVQVENQPELVLVEGHLLLLFNRGAGLRIVVEQALHHPAAEDGLPHDLRHVLHPHVGVEDALRANHHQRTLLAEPVAAGHLDVIFQQRVGALGFQFLPECPPDLLGAVHPAARAAANRDGGAGAVPPGKHPLPHLRQFIR